MDRDPDELTLRQMRIFCAVAREGSITRAAERLGVRQPSVSQQVARIEAVAGGKLVRFVGGEMRLTAAGEFLAAEAQAVLAAADRARAGLAEHAHGRRRRLVVGTLPSLARNLLVPAFARMVGAGAAGGDETLFDVLEMTPREAIGRIEAREIDAALISGYAAETPLAPGLHATEVARDAQYLVVPEGAPDLSQAEAPEETGPLARAIRLDLGSDHAEQLAHWHRLLLPGSEVLARCRSYESALSFVEHGLGTAIMPDLTLRRGGLGPHAVLYALPLPRRRTLLLMPEQDRRHAPMRELTDALDAASRAIAPLEHHAVPPFARERLGGS